MYSSIHTSAIRTVLIPCVSRLSGKLKTKKNILLKLGVFLLVEFGQQDAPTFTHMDGNDEIYALHVNMVLFQLYHRTAIF